MPLKEFSVARNPKLFGEGFIGQTDRMKKTQYGKPLATYTQIAGRLDPKGGK